MLRQHRKEFPAEQANDYQAKLTVASDIQGQYADQQDKLTLLNTCCA
jgi:hypothetical protein